MLNFAQITDTHLNGESLRLHRLDKVIKVLKTCGLVFDALIFTGDIGDSGHLDEYQAAANSLAQLPVPLILCPGNHDDREALSQVFPQFRLPTQRFLNTRHDFKGLTVLALDTLVKGKDLGTLHSDSLSWLKEQLETVKNPVLICLHHPPCRVGHPLVDETVLTNAEDLAHLVKLHKKVVGFVAGHTHTAAASTFAGLPLSLAPGIVSTLRLPNEQRRGLLPLTDAEAAPGYAIHLIREGHLLTHFRTLSMTDD